MMLFSPSQCSVARAAHLVEVVHVRPLLSPALLHVADVQVPPCPCDIGDAGTPQVYEWKGRRFCLDEDWTGCLDAGWDYEIVKETMMQLKCKVNDDQQMKFNDKEEQNGHKCTCMVATDILPEVSCVMLMSQPLQSLREL